MLHLGPPTWESGAVLVGHTPNARRAPPSAKRRLDRSIFASDRSQWLTVVRLTAACARLFPWQRRAGAARSSRYRRAQWPHALNRPASARRRARRAAVRLCACRRRGSASNVAAGSVRSPGGSRSARRRCRARVRRARLPSPARGGFALASPSPTSLLSFFVPFSWANEANPCGLFAETSRCDEPLRGGGRQCPFLRSNPWRD